MAPFLKVYDLASLMQLVTMRLIYEKLRRRLAPYMHLQVSSEKPQEIECMEYT